MFPLQTPLSNKSLFVNIAFLISVTYVNRKPRICLLILKMRLLRSICLWALFIKVFLSLVNYNLGLICVPVANTTVKKSLFVNIAFLISARYVNRKSRICLLILKMRLLQSMCLWALFIKVFLSLVNYNLGLIFCPFNKTSFV